MSLCRFLEVHPSGYYAWRDRPRSQRAIANERLTGLIKQFWLESGGIYRYRKIHSDLRDIGERCGKHRVRRLMKAVGLRAQVGYRRPRHGYVGNISPVLLEKRTLGLNSGVHET
jgi:putative transposase